MIIPLLLCTLIWIFFTLVGFYLAQYHLRLTRQRSWLRDQHHTLEHDPKTYEFSQAVYNIYIPGMDQWITENKKVMGGVWIFQLLNALLAFQILIQYPLTYQPYLLAVGVAAVGYAFSATRTRRHEADTVCYDVMAKVDDLKTQEDTKE